MNDQPGIQVAFIASVHDTPMYSPQGDIDLAFAHLCLSHVAYRTYFIEAVRAGRTVILDNGIMELGTSVDETTLVRVIRDIRPALVTPPEVLQDGQATVSLTRKFIRELPRLNLPQETGLLGVVHGRSWDEWLYNFRLFHNEFDDILRIGIPYDLTFDVPGTDCDPALSESQRMMTRRVQVTNLLAAEGLTEKPVHLLGTIDAIELRQQAKHLWIVSNDSSTVYVTTLRAEKYDSRVGIRGRKHKIDMQSRMPPGRAALFNENALVVRGFATRPFDGGPDDRN
jgi:hypothetical protein